MEYWWSRYISEGNVLTKPRSGHPKSLNIAQASDIIRQIEDDPFLTAKEFARQYNVSSMTIIRFLKEHGLHCQTSATQTRLTDEHKINRIAFCETLLETWRREKLNSIIFSDEKTFSTDVRWQKKCYRPVNERHNTKYISDQTLSGRINAAYWGAISIDGPATDIVKIDGKFNAVKYLQVLNDHAVPAMSQDHHRIYMHDNSPIHTAHIVQEYLHSQRFETMRWCPMSPDLNPIENVWSYVTYNWPKMIQRSDAALHELVTERWLGLYEKRGLHIY